MTIRVIISRVPTPAPPSSIVQTGIVAGVGGQSGATPLTARRNIVTNVVPGAAVILTVQGWPDEKVFNRCGTGQSCEVFPPVGQQIEGYGVNVAVAVADAGEATFTYDGAGIWLVS